MGTNYLPETTMQKYKVYKDQQDFPVVMFVKILKILNKEGSVIYKTCLIHDRIQLSI